MMTQMRKVLFPPIEVNIRITLATSTINVGNQMFFKNNVPKMPISTEIIGKPNTTNKTKTAMLITPLNQINYLHKNI